MAKVERKLESGEDRAQRPRRSSISGRRDILTVRGKEPGFEYRIAKDVPGRVDELLEFGYEVVTHQAQIGDKRVGVPAAEGSPLKVSLGGGATGYVMRQRKEWYDEDQKRKADAIAEAEAGMKRQGLKEHYGNIDVETGSKSA